MNVNKYLESKIISLIAGLFGWKTVEYEVECDTMRERWVFEKTNDSSK